MKKLSVGMTRSELTFGWIYLVLQLTVLAVPIVLLNMLLGNPLSDGQMNFIIFLINFVSVSAIFWRFLCDNGRTGFSRPGRMFATIGITFGVYQSLSAVISILILAVAPDFFNVNDESIALMVQENPVLLTIGTVLLVPMVEEVLYRGLLFRGLYNHSKVAAFLLSIVVFGLLHVVNYITIYEPFHLFLCFLQYIPAGLCFGFAYAFTDSIWTPILMHMTVNLIGMLSMLGG